MSHQIDHHSGHHVDHHAHGSDMKAAFTGLLVGAVAILVVVYSIVQLTNRHYAGEKAAVETHK